MTLRDDIYAEIALPRAAVWSRPEFADELTDKIMAHVERHAQKSVEYVDEGAVRKSVISALTRCAETAESHDWNEQAHRQRMVNAIILSFRPYLQKSVASVSEGEPSEEAVERVKKALLPLLTTTLPYNDVKLTPTERHLQEVAKTAIAAMQGKAAS